MKQKLFRPIDWGFLLGIAYGASYRLIFDDREGSLTGFIVFEVIWLLIYVIVRAALNRKDDAVR